MLGDAPFPSIGLVGVASDDRDVNANAAAAIEWLETNDDWLAVFDDVCDPQSALKFLPSIGGGDVVVTSRFGGDWTAIAAASIPLDVFSDEEAVAFLRARTGERDDDTARAISTGLGNLPSRCRLATITSGCVDSGPLFLNAGTWSITQKRSRLRGAWLWRESYGQDHPRLVPLLVNLATSLYEAGDGAAAVPVAHRAVRIEEQLSDKNGGRHASTLMVLARCEQRAGALRASRKTFLEAYRLAERSDAVALAATALSSAGDIARELDELAPAERFLERALALQRTAGVEDDQYAMTLTRLGSVRRAQRRPAEAAALHRQASGLLLAQDPESSGAMDALNNLGNALGEIGEIAKAIDALQHSYQIAMRLYGVGHPETWIIAVNLAMPLLWSGQEAAAREVLAAAQGVDPDEVEVAFSAGGD